MNEAWEIFRREFEGRLKVIEIEADFKNLENLPSLRHTFELLPTLKPGVSLKLPFAVRTYDDDMLEIDYYSPPNESLTCEPLGRIRVCQTDEIYRPKKN